MATRKLNFLLWFSALALVLACVPAIGAPVPTVDPNQINIFIAETVQAAATQTSAAMPTSTPTETPTSTPVNTFTPSPTYTATVIFILSTPTSLVFPTFTAVSSGSVSGGGGSGTSGTSSENFACQVISVDPANGTSFNGRTDFDAVWRVKNIGQKVWDRSSVDYSYDSGAKMHKTDVYDLSANVKSGETISIVVDMITPRDAGSYTTYWVLNSSNKEFCKLSLTINVR